MSQRWKRNGRVLLLDGVQAIYLEREVIENKAALSPVECDAIADLLCETLNKTDLKKLRDDWMAKP